MVARCAPVQRRNVSCNSREGRRPHPPAAARRHRPERRANRGTCYQLCMARSPISCRNDTAQVNLDILKSTQRIDQRRARQGMAARISSMQSQWNLADRMRTGRSSRTVRARPRTTWTLRRCSRPAPPTLIALERCCASNVAPSGPVPTSVTLVPWTAISLPSSRYDAMGS
eukprot:731551-Pleurochrysis_carterae.AAC.3